MKIRKLRISHFGKFQNAEFSFTDGINLISGDNESGKTTMHAFIRAMLFGIDKSRGRAGKDDLYTKYRPWDSPGAYQGSMDFEHDGKEYRITRVFYQKEKSCVLTDLETGRQIPLADDRITSLIPELTLSAYNNTISSGQLKTRPEDTLADEVRNYIANLSTARAQEVDVPGALDRLNDKRKKLIVEQNGLNLDRLRREREQLLDTELDFNTFIRDKEQGTAEISELREQKAQFCESDDCRRADEFNLIPAQEERLKNLLQHKHEADELDERTDELRARKQKLEEELKDGHEKAKNCREIVESNHIMAESEQSLTTTQVAGYRRFTIVGGAAAVLGVLIPVLLRYKGISSIPVTLVLLIIAIAGVVTFILSVIKKKETLIAFGKKQKIYEEAFKQYDILGRQMQELLASKNAELAGCEERLKENVEQVGVLFSRLDKELKTAVAELTGETPEDASTDDLWMRLPSVAELHGRYEAGRKQRDMVRATIDSYDDRIRRKGSELERISWELERIGDIGARLETNRQELEAAEQKETKLATELEAVKLATTTIEQLANEIHDSFGTQINVLLSEEADRVTDGRYKEARVNRDFGIEVMSGMDYVPVESLSTGAAEQLYMALRFAVTAMFFDGVEVPLLMDESFAFYDNDRMRSTLKTLGSRQQSQILLFTCQDRERRLMDEEGVAYTLVELD